MHPFRSALTTLLVAVALAAWAPGCGDSTTSHDPAATYSPASLAQELVFRYKALDPARRNAPRPRPARKPDASATKEAKAATKEAPAASLDDLIDDIKKKAASVPDSTVDAVIRQVAAEVDKDPSLAVPERQIVSDRLRAAGP